MEFKDTLKKIRIEKNLTQKELAEQIYVSRSAVAKWEAGLGLPSEDSLEALMNYFHVDKDYFYPRVKEEDVQKDMVKKNRIIIRHRIEGIIGMLGFILLCILILCVADHECKVLPLRPSYELHLDYEDYSIQKKNGYYIGISTEEMYIIENDEGDISCTFSFISDEEKIEKDGTKIIDRIPYIDNFMAWKKIGFLYKYYKYWKDAPYEYHTVYTEDKEELGSFYVLKYRKKYCYYFKPYINMTGTSLGDGLIAFTYHANLKSPAWSNNLAFSSDNEAIELENNYYFESETDYTDSLNTLYLSGIKLYIE